MLQRFLFLLVISMLFQNSLAQSKKSSPLPPLLNLEITLNLHDVSLEKALISIHNKYSVNFSYSEDFIPLNTFVSIRANKKKLKYVLDQLFADLRVGYLVVGDVIVLVKKDFAEELKQDSLKVQNQDSLKVYSLTPQSRIGGHKYSYKLSLKDLLKYPVYLGLLYNVQYDKDSLKVVRAKLDSLHEFERKLRKARIKLINSQSEFYRFSLGISFRPEWALWSLSASDPGKNFSPYNDYGYPDLSYSFSLFLRVRLRRKFFIQPSFLYTSLNRKGIHTDYLVSLLNPGVSNPVSSNFSSNYGFATFSCSGGIETRLKKVRLSFAPGIFISRLANRQAPDYFPYYQPVYYFLGPPYYDNNHNRLYPEKINYRNWNYGVSFSTQVIFILTENLDFFTGIRGTWFLKSIYGSSSSIKEQVKTAGLELGVRVNFSRRRGK